MLITLRIPAAKRYVVSAVRGCQLASPSPLLRKIGTFGAFVDLVVDAPSDSPDIYIRLLDTLARVSLLWMFDHPSFARLYHSGTRYEREVGTEIWQSAPYTLQTKKGDCEDLATFRTAELWYHGIQAGWPDGMSAKNRLTGADMPFGGRMWHVTVRRDSGVEDPSKKLGMKGES